VNRASKNLLNTQLA
jgi:hypothetical protein